MSHRTHAGAGPGPSSKQTIAGECPRRTALGGVDRAVGTCLTRASGSALFPALVVLVALALSLASWVPRYSRVDAFADTPFGQAKAWWLAHPFQNVPVETFFPLATRHIVSNAGEASHLDKLAFRGLLPLVHRIAPFGVWTLVVASHLGAVAILWLTFHLVSRHACDAACGALASWTVATCYAGQWGFHDFIYGDAVAVGLMLGVMATRSPIAIFMLAFAAHCTDERAAACGPLLILFHALTPSREDQPPPPAVGLAATRRPSPATSRGGAIIAALAAYAAVRAVATQTMGATLGTTMLATADILRTHVYADYPEQVFKVFEFLWLAPFIVVVEWWGAGQSLRARSLCYAACMALAAGPALLVVDIDRSLSYLLPGVLLAICHWPFSTLRLRTFLLAVLLGNTIWLYPATSLVASVAQLVARTLAPSP
jgi:hypothetical protein